jgi:hypothetical protein
MCLLTIKDYLDFCHYNSASLQKRHYYSPNVNKLTRLHGKYTGQLASATSVAGHNWLFYVAYAIFDSETYDNWTWFFEQLYRAVGCPLSCRFSDFQ